jgi:hypothetical protein
MELCCGWGGFGVCPCICIEMQMTLYSTNTISNNSTREVQCSCMVLSKIYYAEQYLVNMVLD